MSGTGETKTELTAEQIAAAEQAKTTEQTKTSETTSAEQTASGETTKTEGGETTAAGETKTETTEPDWREKRIAVLTARLAEERTKNAQPKTTTTETGDTVPRSEVDRLAGEQARIMAANAAFNQACNDVAIQGRKAYPDFDAKVAELRKLVDPSDPQQAAAYNQFLADVLDTGDGAKIIHTLGSDLNEASRVLGLAGARRGMELVQIVNRAPGEISKLDKPITALRGGGAAHSTIRPDDPERGDSLTTAEWMKRREEQVAKSQGARR